MSEENFSWNEEGKKQISALIQNNFSIFSGWEKKNFKNTSTEQYKNDQLKKSWQLLKENVKMYVRSLKKQIFFFLIFFFFLLFFLFLQLPPFFLFFFQILIFFHSAFITQKNYL